MDIHKPKAAHSLREFLIEIGTIVLGILIALGLEAAVEAYRSHELVDRARIDLRAELRANRETLASTIAGEKATAAPLDALIRYARDRLQGKAPKIGPDIQLSMDFRPMSTAAWESTVATQALVHMPYEEARALTRVYAGTRVYSEYESEAARRWIELDTYTDTPESLSTDELRSAKRLLLLNQAYQQTLTVSGEHLLELYDKALAQLK
jgi:hypothetical protein